MSQNEIITINCTMVKRFTRPLGLNITVGILTQSNKYNKKELVHLLKINFRKPKYNKNKQ